MGKRLALIGSLFLLSIATAAAQQFSYGIKGGYPLTFSENHFTSVNISLDSNSRQFIVGGTGEIGLPFGVSVEGDFLFHPYNVRNAGILGISTITNYTVFEVPILAKVRLSKGLAEPYVDAGPEFRTHPGNLSLSHDGFVMGGGIEFKLLLAKVSPEIRYTRWANSTFAGANPNQVALLVGVTF